MGNRVVIGILVIIALILTGAGFTWFKNNSSTSVDSTPSDQQSAPSPVVTASVNSDTRVALKDLFSSSKSQKCTFSDNNSGSSGVVYMSGGKMRGDFTSKTDGQSVESHMIVENQTSYVWTDASTQGVKMSYEKVTQLTSATASAQAGGSSMPISMDQKVSYQCESWVADPTLLTLPTTVKFNDFSSLIPQIKASTSGAAVMDPKSACGACDQLSDTQRDQCRKALSC
jgi:uncharacterized membrane protein